MSWKIEYNSGKKLIELEYSGLISGDDLKKAFEKVIEYIYEYKTVLVLADCTKMSTGHTLFDLLGLLEDFEKLDVLRNVKEAVLLSTGHESAVNISFWETACQNRGFKVRIFEEKEEAVKWLINIK